MKSFSFNLNVALDASEKMSVADSQLVLWSEEFGAPAADPPVVWVPPGAPLPAHIPDGAEVYQFAGRPSEVTPGVTRLSVCIDPRDSDRGLWDLRTVHRAELCDGSAMPARLACTPSRAGPDLTLRTWSNPTNYARHWHLPTPQELAGSAFYPRRAEIAEVVGVPRCVDLSPYDSLEFVQVEDPRVLDELIISPRVSAVLFRCTPEIGASSPVRVRRADGEDCTESIVTFLSERRSSSDLGARRRATTLIVDVDQNFALDLSGDAHTEHLVLCGGRESWSRAQLNLRGSRVTTLTLADRGAVSAVFECVHQCGRDFLVTRPDEQCLETVEVLEIPASAFPLLYDARSGPAISLAFCGLETTHVKQVRLLPERECERAPVSVGPMPREIGALSAMDLYDSPPLLSVDVGYVWFLSFQVTTRYPERVYAPRARVLSVSVAHGSTFNAEDAETRVSNVRRALSLLHGGAGSRGSHPLRVLSVWGTSLPELAPHVPSLLHEFREAFPALRYLVLPQPLSGSRTCTYINGVAVICSGSFTLTLSELELLSRT